MSWVTRMTLGHATVAHRKLWDAYDWHQAVWECFPDHPHATRDFLTRLDHTPTGFRLTIVSLDRPERPDWCSESSWQSIPIPSAYFKRTHFAFQLRVNPTKKVRVENADGSPKKNGRRIPIRQPGELAAWLERKGTNGGFRIELETLQILPEGPQHFVQTGRRGTHSSVDFRGTLQVTESEKFYQTLHKGIGSAKAFGFGLLLITPTS
jgi:CRISPR system Cascade subunit CasE